jgi:hypothetical protein
MKVPNAAPFRTVLSLPAFFINHETRAAFVPTKNKNHETDKTHHNLTP